MGPLFSIIIINYNGKDFSVFCIESVLKSNYSNLEVILVDNASSDGSLNLIEDRFCNDNRIKIIRSNKNLHFAEGNNLGIRNAKGEFVVLLNNDTEVESSWLDEIEIIMRDSSIGASQPKILRYYEREIIENTGSYTDKFGYTHCRGYLEKDVRRYNKVEEIFFAGGTAMVIRLSVIREVGLLDSKFLINLEDLDLSWRIRLRGYRIVYIPKSIVYHKGSGTVLKFPGRVVIHKLSRKNRIATLIKNYGLLRLSLSLPIIFVIYTAVFFKELFIDKDFRFAVTSISAIFWNIKEFPYLLKQRKIVQKIRIISDKEIIKHMCNSPIFIEQYFKPLIKKHLRRLLPELRYGMGTSEDLERLEKTEVFHQS